MPLTAMKLSTRLSDSEEELYIESPTLTQVEESEDNLENDKDIVPRDASDASNISEKTGNDTAKVSAEHMPLGGTAIEEEMLKVYKTVLDGDRAMPERKDAFRQLLRETDGKAYNQRELAATCLLAINVMESDILDEKEEIFALLKLLQHQDENVRTLAFDQLPFLIPRCPPSAVDYTVSVVVQNLRKSLATCTWSSPSEAQAIQSSALYLAGHHPAAFFNEIFPDATGTHHDPLKWLSENYSTLKTTTFIEYPEAGEELIRVMEKCGGGVVEGMDKCIRALECSVGILEIWKGLVRVPGEVGIALLGTWLGGSPREFLGYGRTRSSEALAVALMEESGSHSVKEGELVATKIEAPPSTSPSTFSSKSERSQESHIKFTSTRNAKIPSNKQRLPPAPVNTKRKSYPGDHDPSMRRSRLQSTHIEPTTAPVSVPFARGFKRRRYDSFRPESPRNPRKENRKHSYTPTEYGAGTAIVCNPTSVLESHQRSSNQQPHRNLQQQYSYSSRPYSPSIPPGPTPPPLKPAVDYRNNIPMPPTPPLTATWQTPFQGQSPKFPRRVYPAGGGASSGRNERRSRGQDMWGTERHWEGPTYMGYQQGGRWFSSHGSRDRYRGEAGGGEGSNQSLGGAGGGSANVPPRSPSTLKISTPSKIDDGTTVGSESGNMVMSDSTHPLV